MLSIIIPLRNEIENLDSIKESFSKSLSEIKYEDMGNKSEYAYTILSNVLISLL